MSGGGGGDRLVYIGNLLSDLDEDDERNALDRDHYGAAGLSPPRRTRSDDEGDDDEEGEGTDPDYQPPGGGAPVPVTGGGGTGARRASKRRKRNAADDEAAEDRSADQPPRGRGRPPGSGARERPPAGPAPMGWQYVSSTVVRRSGARGGNAPPVADGGGDQAVRPIAMSCTSPYYDADGGYHSSCDELEDDPDAPSPFERGGSRGGGGSGRPSTWQETQRRKDAAQAECFGCAWDVGDSAALDGTAVNNCNRIILENYGGMSNFDLARTVHLYYKNMIYMPALMRARRERMARTRIAGASSAPSAYGMSTAPSMRYATVASDPLSSTPSQSSSSAARAATTQVPQMWRTMTIKTHIEKHTLNPLLRVGEMIRRNLAYEDELEDKIVREVQFSDGVTRHVVDHHMVKSMIMLTRSTIALYNTDMARMNFATAKEVRTLGENMGRPINPLKNLVWNTGHDRQRHRDLSAAAGGSINGQRPGALSGALPHQGTAMRPTAGVTGGGGGAARRHHDG